MKEPRSGAQLRGQQPVYNAEHKLRLRRKTDTRPVLFSCVYPLEGLIKQWHDPELNIVASKQRATHNPPTVRAHK